MLSPDLLTANITALTQAQGKCPTLGPLPPNMRVVPAGKTVQVELRTATGGWQPVDFPSRVRAGTEWLRGGSSPDARQIVLVGPGLGRALAALESTPISRVIAIEPHAGLATLLLSAWDWCPWFASGRLRLLTGPDFTGAADIARVLDGLTDISIVVHPMRARIEPEAMAQASSVAARVAQNARANGHARRKFAAPYLLQTLTNLPAIAREADLAALDGACAGMPAVVVGAGPSLDANGPVLATLQDRAVIVSADTALGPLLAHGVRPHIAVGVDSSALNARHLTTPAATEDVALAAEGSLHASALARFRGRTFGFRIAAHEPWPWLREGGIERAELKTWGSVLTSAFNLARRMGADPIVFVGADLAFTGMRPYCRGTIYDAMWQEWIDKGCTWEALMEEYFSRQPEMWRRDVHGRETRTAPHLVSFRDWIADQTASATSGTFINATADGILHGGRIVQAPLESVLSGWPRVTGVRDTIRACHADAVARRDDVRLAEWLAANASGEALPIARWIAFAASTIAREEIVAAIADAAAVVASQGRSMASANGTDGAMGRAAAAVAGEAAARSV